MAIVRDSFTVITTVTASSHTYSHTCSGSDRLLLVGITKRTNDDITGVTYNGTAMTQLIKRDHADSTEWLYIYGLLNPDIGTNNVVISAGGSSAIYSGSVSYTGVGQSQTLTDIVGFSASNSITLTSIVDNSSMFVYVQNSINNPDASTNSTLLDETNGSAMLESNPLLITPAGNFTMSYTGTNNDSVGVIFAPVTGESFSIAETLALSETTTNLRERLSTTAETLSLSETITAAKGLIITIAESLNLTETYNYVWNRVFTIAENIGLVEVLAQVKPLWSKATKSSSSWTGASKNSSSWTEETKNGGSWTNTNKS